MITSTEQPTVVMVDDDFAIMRCVAMVLQQEDGIRVIGQTTHAQAGVAMAVRVKPDLVLLDIHMPGGDAFEACREITSFSTQPAQVLFYTGHPRDQYLDRAIAAGASGLVSKHSESIQNLALAIRHVLAGNTYFSPELAKRLVELKEGAPQSRVSTLSHRQLEVLRSIARGMTQPAVAEALDVSERTVHNEVKEIKKKLELGSTNELLIFAVTEGLVFPELLSI